MQSEEIKFQIKCVYDVVIIKSTGRISLRVLVSNAWIFTSTLVIRLILRLRRNLRLNYSHNSEFLVLLQ
jgi:hypothetical protein